MHPATSSQFPFCHSANVSLAAKLTLLRSPVCRTSRAGGAMPGVRRVRQTGGSAGHSRCLGDRPPDCLAHVR
ncbi:hypothetical protein THTE_1318 [Thermogutta terrifontis]|uniref:Uncharacterized protein n=1 Tax=Thermogutta terrifontis TaxID=1331910 RepID=A0A286RD73_9BACT|nr:hypothetical protein THTE_1318 [Thermogutta terrifontis]